MSLAAVNPGMDSDLNSLFAAVSTTGSKSSSLCWPSQVISYFSLFIIYFMFDDPQMKKDSFELLSEKAFVLFGFS